MQVAIEVIVGIIILIIVGIYICWQIEKKGLKNFVVSYILEAEKEYKKGENSSKMDFVVIHIRKILQSNSIGNMISLFITDKNIQDFVQTVFDEIKKALDYIPQK